MLDLMLALHDVLPEPIKKNLFKAFDQLCTAAIDIPVAHLEGIAAEKRAETTSRVKLISTSAEQIAAQMDMNPEFARLAVQKFGQRVIRERVNLDKICDVAATQITQQITDQTFEQNPTASTSEINEDWLNNFEVEASHKSTEEMQLLFGKILAGEIQRPSSFSIKTVKLIGQLDPSVAILFRRLCSLCIYLKDGNQVLDARVVSLAGNAASNSLMKYGLGFGSLNILHEHGLIIADYNSYSDYRISVKNLNQNSSLPFLYQNQEWALVNNASEPWNRELRLNGVALSRAGIELSSIVDLENFEEYTSALSDYFKTQGLQMVPIKS